MTPTALAQLAKQRNLYIDLVRASHRGELATIDALLAQGADPKEEDSRPLRQAAGAGHAECVRKLLPHSDIPESNALVWASAAGHIECVRILIPEGKPSGKGCQALVAAAKNGHAECVKLLIPASFPAQDSSHALRMAARNGHVECARLLLPVSQPLFEHPELIHGALIDGQAQAAALMFEYEPRLWQRLDLVEALRTCSAAGHGEMAALLTSIIEKNELSAMGGGQRSSAPSARL